MRSTALSALFLLILLFIACTRVETESWPGGNRKSEIHMKGNIYHGPARYWYEDGPLQMECNYKENKLNGRLIRYFSNGKKEEERFYNDGLIVGLKRTWIPSGTLVSESIYNRGKLHGSHHDFYPSQRLKIEGEYINGQMEGRWLYYDELGNIIQITVFKKNLKDGWEVTYNQDGSIKYKRNYKLGQVIQ